MLSRPSIPRSFHANVRLQLPDGDWREKFSRRVRIPYIEALHQQQASAVPSFERPQQDAPERDLTPRKMSASFNKVTLPLAQDPWLLDQYITSAGHIRIGTLFMDLDALAGMVAYAHTGEGVTIVTAAVDRIQMRRPIREICDLELSGQVTFATGRSSMEVSLQVAKAPAPGTTAQSEDVLLTSTFTMVALDPHSKQPVAVPGLQVDSPEEQRLFDLGQTHYNAKKALVKMYSTTLVPSSEERRLVANLKTSKSQKRGLGFMHVTQVMQPQYRNRHNFMIFGGFLLQQTFELAFCCAAARAHTRPSFVSLEPSTFKKPVPVGSILYLKAMPVYSEVVGEQTRIQIQVASKVRDVEHGSAEVVGEFNYTFLVDTNAGLAEVIPTSDAEITKWIAARRRAQQMEDSTTSDSQATLVSSVIA